MSFRRGSRLKYPNYKDVRNFFYNTAVWDKSRGASLSKTSLTRPVVSTDHRALVTDGLRPLPISRYSTVRSACPIFNVQKIYISRCHLRMF